jgi:shikimate dehydrogenase
MTAFLRALHFHGCPFQAGSDMLFEQVPVYLKFFDFSMTTLDERLDRDPERRYRRYRPQ